MPSKDRQQSSKIWEIIRSPLNKVRTQEYRKLKETFNGTSFQRKEEEDIISMREVKVAIER